ncbi:hypothetical protein [Thermodesulfitimonas sp.]
MGKRWFLLVIVALMGVAWGVGHCLGALNGALGPERAVRALGFTVLSETAYRIEFLNVHYTLRLPAPPKLLAEACAGKDRNGLSYLERCFAFRP